jgi:hypothetical protein
VLHYNISTCCQRVLDGPWIPRHDEASVYTIVGYLNDEFTGGTTDFMHSDTLPSSTSDASGFKNVAASIAPVPGRVLIFTHDCLHQGAPVLTGTKYIFRTELMYCRQRLPPQLDRYVCICPSTVQRLYLCLCICCVGACGNP